LTADASSPLVKASCAPGQLTLTLVKLVSELRNNAEFNILILSFANEFTTITNPNPGAQKETGEM